MSSLGKVVFVYSITAAGNILNNISINVNKDTRNIQGKHEYIFYKFLECQIFITRYVWKLW